MSIFESAIEKVKELPATLNEKVKSIMTPSECQTSENEYVENPDQLEAQEGDAFGVENVEPITGKVNPQTTESLTEGFKGQDEGFLQDVMPPISEPVSDDALPMEVDHDGEHPVKVERFTAVIFPQNTDIDDYILPNETQGLEAVGSGSRKSEGFLEGLFGPKKTDDDFDDAVEATDGNDLKRGDVAGTMDLEEACNTGPTSNAI